MTIHNWIYRLLVSFVVLVCVLIIVLPHLMDVQPPMLVRVLMWPMYLFGPAVGRMLPHGNIGTVEHPVYEGTPLDLMAGLLLVIFSILWYPVFTFVLLTVVSSVQSRRRHDVS